MKENHYLCNPETNDTNTSSSIKNKMWRKAWWFITITSAGWSSDHKFFERLEQQHIDSLQG